MASIGASTVHEQVLAALNLISSARLPHVLVTVADQPLDRQPRERSGSVPPSGRSRTHAPARVPLAVRIDLGRTDNTVLATELVKTSGDRS